MLEVFEDVIIVEDDSHLLNVVGVGGFLPGVGAAKSVSDLTGNDLGFFIAVVVFLVGAVELSGLGGFLNLDDEVLAIILDKIWILGAGLIVGWH